jgi:hypothetical protein
MPKKILDFSEVLGVPTFVYPSVYTSIYPWIYPWIRPRAILGSIPRPIPTHIQQRRIIEL